MIKWEFNIAHTKLEKVATYTPSPSEILQINETDIVEILVVLSKEYNDFGDPYIIVGDIPIDLNFHSYSDNSKKFIADKYEANSLPLFYNYFGESEIKLKFKNNHDILETIKIDVKARKENATLAKSMLDYISKNMPDLVALCFSKSSIESGFNSSDQDSMQKLTLLREAINKFHQKIELFRRDYRHTFESVLQISQQGQPIGPDSIHWLLKNIDKVSPSNIESANIKINNRTFSIAEAPSERVIENTDIFENRVIHGFLYSSRQFLFELKCKLSNTRNEGHPKKTTTNNLEGFISFDHTLQSMKNEIIDHHIDDINNLILTVNKLTYLSKNKFNSKLIPQLRPRVTPFVANRPHYRELFQSINKWYNSDEPDLDKNGFLLGLRNLSSIYEITALLMLLKDISRNFNTKITDQRHQIYNEDLPFEGFTTKRPKDRPNNYFIFSEKELSIELLFEPKIYSYRKGVSKSGDIINTSNKRSTKYGGHYYSPDYILKIRKNSWEEPLTIILDAKYSDRKNVLNYYLKETSSKYLNSLFQVGRPGTATARPVKLFMILFAHGKDSPASFLHKQHHITGDLPAYPQGVGIKYTPQENSAAFEWIRTCFKNHDLEQTH